MHFSNSVEDSCYKILSSVMSSPLNFMVKETQFSIYITVRKTEAKVKEPKKVKLEESQEIKVQSDVRYKLLEIENNKLQFDLEEVINESEEKSKKILELERILDDMHIKVKDNVELKSKLDALQAEFDHSSEHSLKRVSELEEKIGEAKAIKDNLEAVLTELKDLREEKDLLEIEAQFLEISDKNQRSINIRLNNEMIQSRTRLLKEKADQLKTLKKEIKYWKKLPGNKNKKCLKLKSIISKSTENQSSKLVSASSPTSGLLTHTHPGTPPCSRSHLQKETKGKKDLQANVSKENLLHEVVKEKSSSDEPREDLEMVITTDKDSNKDAANSEAVNTELESITAAIIEFYKAPPENNLEIMIFKLESIKNLLKTDKFDEMIASAKAFKNSIEQRSEEAEDEEFESYLDLPPHHYGSDGEIIIGDD